MPVGDLRSKVLLKGRTCLRPAAGKEVNVLNGPTAAPTLLEVDGRRRISLGVLAEHDRYLAHVETDGTIVLTPAVVLSVAEARLHASGPVVEEIDEFLAKPTIGNLRRRRTSEGSGKR